MNGSEKVRKDVAESMCMTRKYYKLPCKTCVLYESSQCPEYKKQGDKQLERGKVI